MPSDHSGETNPRDPRVPYDGQVAVKARNSANDSAFVKNLSRSGIFLLSARKYLVGTELLVYLPLDLGNRRTLCMVSGKIVRVETAQAAQKVQGYGVQFHTDLSTTSRKMLQDFVTLKTTGERPEISKVKPRLSPHRD